MKIATETEDDDGVQSTGNLHSTDDTDNQMETCFYTLKSEPRMAAANPVYDSTYSLTVTPACSTRSATATSNPLYTFSVEEEIGKVNYGAKGDEDGSDAKI